MRNTTTFYYNTMALTKYRILSTYQLSFLFTIIFLIISLFFMNDVYAGNTSSGALDTAYDETKKWINDVFRFFGVAAVTVAVINVIIKFNAYVLLSCIAVGLICMFGIEVMEEMTGALI